MGNLAEAAAPRRAGGLAPSLMIAVLAAAAAGGAALLHSRHAAHLEPDIGPLVMPWWLIAAVFAVVEMLIINLPVRRDSHSISLSEIPLILGLAFASPAALVIGRLVGGGGALAIFRRQQPLKLAFNASLFYLETVVAISVFGLIKGSAGANTPHGWVALLVAMAAVQVTGASLVTMAIAINDRRPPTASVVRSLAASTAISMVTGLLGLLAMVVLWKSAWGALVLGGLGVMLAGALRTYGALNRRHDHLLAVYAFAEAVGAVADPAEMTDAVVNAMVELLRVDAAVVAVPTADGSLLISPAAADPTGGHAAAHRLTERCTDRRRARFLDHEELAMLQPILGRKPLSAMAVAVALDGGTGFITVADRVGGESLTKDDLDLFSALSGHAGIAMERAGLVDRLRGEAAQRKHEALHDALTGLPNRALFSSTVVSRAATSLSPRKSTGMASRLSKRSTSTPSYTRSRLRSSPLARCSPGTRRGP